jgi:ATP-dependent exoDNAse (exonuclease V) alpha subunit
MEQAQALEILKSGANVFLTGEPGAGKSHVIGLFSEWLGDRPFAVTASTGIAATHIGGTTIHSWAGLGIDRNLTTEQIDSITYNRFKYRRIKPVRTLIIDEVSMLDAVNIDDIDAVLKAVHGNNRPFGGIQVVMVGDFFQLPPVSKDGRARLAFESRAWEAAGLATCYLTEQHRQSDAQFLDLLSAMRSGEMTEAHMALLESCRGKEIKATRIYTHNIDVDRINSEELAKLSGKERRYQMESGGDDYAVTALKKSCLSPETLKLKVGAVVMFTRNNPNVGYANGTVGTVKSFKDNLPVVALTDGNEVTPEQAEWKVKDERGQVRSWIRQLPLRLAWAITVHKSQGMSMDSASVDLSGAFECGQGYVAISRVRSLDGLHLIGMNDRSFVTNDKVIEQDVKFRKTP